MDLNNILGVVLAGGKSQRFGQDKSQVKLKGKLLIDYILNEIVDEFKETLIIANDPINYMQSDKISITKDFKSGLGPLGGVLTGMKWIKEKNKSYKWISTFLSPFNKSASSFSNKSNDQRPKMLCLVWLFLIKNSLLSL